jgi:hypothetical protein
MARAREYAEQMIKSENARNFPNENLVVSDDQIRAKMDELAQDELGRGGQDPADWARREIMVEEWRMAGTDYARLRRGVPAGANPVTFVENILGANARALGLSGVRIDPETGKAITPDQLFKENPVAADDPIVNRNLRAYIKTYNAWLNDPSQEVPSGVKVARDGNVQSLANNPNVDFYSINPDDPTAPRENTFGVLGPDGRVVEKQPKQRRDERKARNSQVKNMAGRNLLAPGDAAFGLKRWGDGRVRAGGRRLPQSIILQNHWKPWLPIINMLEGMADSGESVQVRYFAVGNSADKVKTAKLKDVDAINREMVFDQWTTNAAGDLLAQFLDLTAMRNRAMRAIGERNPALDPANGGPGYSLQAIMDDVNQWMADKRAGKAGEATIGPDRKNIVNALINPGTTLNRGKNPLAGSMGKGSAIKTLILEGINAVSGTGRKGAAMDYNWANGNFMPDQPPRPDVDIDLPQESMPQQIPREAQGMPDVGASGRGDGMPDSQQRVTSYHLTDDPNFSLDKSRKPQNNTTLGGDWPNAGIFVGDSAERWFNGYNYVRPFVVELSHPPIESMGSRAMAGGGYGGEKFIPAEAFDSVEVRRVIPYDEYARETFGEFGPIEEYFNLDSQGSRLPEPVAEAGTLFSQRPKDSLRNYRYTGKDVRKMSPAQRRALIKRTQDYARATRPEMFADQPAAAPRGQAMPDARPADFAQPSITDGPLEVEDSPLRISTRTPSAKAATENPLTSQLSIDTAAIAGAGALAKTTGVIAQYPGIRFASKNPVGRAQEFIRFAADNLLWLHDQVPADIRPRSSLWYDGARNISVRWSGEYGIPRQGNAAAIAALSPQKDWYMNVSLARRVLEMVTKNQDRVFGDAEMQWAKQRMKQAAPIQKMLAGIKGKRFADMTTYEKAVFSRAFDEINNPRGYEILSPEGEFIGPATNKDGSPSRVAWGDFNSIAKAVTVSEDPRAEVISRALGEEHKVRSFYNNIILPNYARFGDVTIDTHAVAGALLRPLAGSDTPVLHNFGGSGAGGSAITGHSGTYGLYADAYRLAASERGILPRQMQSITWEAVRGLFSPEWKTASNKALVDKVWTQYKKGEIDINETRKQISDSAGGIAAPSWYRPNP